MSWFDKLLPQLKRRWSSDKDKSEKSPRKKTIPEGLWSKCPSCETVLYRTDLEQNSEVCPKCGYHHRLMARQRLELLFDENSEMFEIGSEITPIDTLKFKDTKKYIDRISEAEKETNETEALIVMQGKIKTLPVVACAFEFKFMGGSMGSVVGERFIRGVQVAIEKKCPFICFSASGGARMQEGLMSLMQMSKTTAALTLLARHDLPFISVLTDPTMGGVSASFAFVGDVVIAEPNALIGFAGPRVIEQTVRQTLPEGFQRAEFLLEHGAIDMVVDRRELRDTLSNIMTILMKKPSANSN